jgi:hypothetical protein
MRKNHATCSALGTSSSQSAVPAPIALEQAVAFPALCDSSRDLWAL